MAWGSCEVTAAIDACWFNPADLFTSEQYMWRTSVNTQNDFSIHCFSTFFLNSLLIIAGVFKREP